jgi:uncharacterized membrane protein
MQSRRPAGGETLRAVLKFERPRPTDPQPPSGAVRYGVSDDFVQQVGGLIQPGDSAVFAVIRTGDPEVVAEHFRGYGGTILNTTLSPTKAAKVQETIRTRA